MPVLFLNEYNINVNKIDSWKFVFDNLLHIIAVSSIIPNGIFFHLIFEVIHTYMCYGLKIKSMYTF